jgi:hypothetical protein
MLEKEEVWVCGVGLRTILRKQWRMEKIFYFLGIGGWRKNLFVLNLARMDPLLPPLSS